MNKSKRVIPESIGLFIPAQKFRKRLSIVFLALISTWVFPPHAIAYEVAQAQQKAQIEQHARDQRTKPPPYTKISQQTEATSQLLIKTCRQIENNLITGKSIDSEIKDILAYQKNYEEIKERVMKQMATQRAQMVEQKSPEKMLERIDTRQKEITSRFEEMSVLLKAVSDNKSKTEELKKAVQNLSKYLEEHTKKTNVAPKSADPKAKVYLPRRSGPADYVASITSSVPHNGLYLASASDKTIGDWLQGTTSVSGPATAADLAATPEIVIDDEIRDLAASLENHPLKIFEYVRNGFAYEPYWGSQKGSKRTLLEKAGNDIDLASLTMALLRASGINCRYVCGTIEMTIEEAGKWIGVDDPTQIAKTFQANGIPFETITSAGKIAKIKLNHTWIVAYVDYFPYHGTRNEKPNTWIEIDPSFKQNTFTMKSDLQTTIGINPDTLLVNVKAQSELGPDNLYAAKVPEPFILSEIFSYQEPIRSYLAANSLTTENVFRQRKVNEERYGLFTVTDNYKIISRGLSFNKLPESLSGTVTFTLKNPDNSTVFSYKTMLSSIAMSRITLGYAPIDDSNRELIIANAGRDEFPVYIVNLKPELKIDDTVVGSGSSIGMGRKQFLEVTFNVPGFDPSLSRTPVTVGSFSALVPDYQTVTAAEISRQHAKLAGLPANLASSRDVVLGESLRAIGLSYWHQLDRFNQVTAGNLGVAITRVPSMIRVAWDLNISEQFGLPHTASVNRIKLDVINDYNVPVAINQDKLVGEKQFAFTSALTGTALEHNVLAQPFAGEAASAVRVIQQANNTNKKVYTITAKNINDIIPLLNLPATMISDIRNAVNANQEVTVPESSVNLHGIEYYAYARRDIDTSASEFFLDSRGGEMVNNTLSAADLLLDGSAASYANVTKPMTDWLNIVVDSTTNAGLAYLPAITALNSWYAKRTTLDPVTTIAAIIAVSGPITKVYNQPAILNVVTGDKLISPNGDNVKDSFTLSAVVTRNAAWKFQILNSQNQPVITEENNTPNINIDFNQKIPDGTYTYRVTAVANGVNADPISGTFRVDCTPPTVAFTSPDAATAITQNKSILLKGTADDINFEKVVITAKAVDAAEPVVIHESNDITVENLLATIVSAKYTNGPLEITMVATDKAGNKSTISKTFNLDNPVPDLQAPTVNMIAKNGTADIIAGSTVDAESGKLDISITAADNIRVAKINLLLDGTIAATVADKTELAHALNTMTLRDGAHTLQAEAYDAAGNSTKSALLNFTLTSPISNFKVTPTLAKPGTSQINVTANLREAANWTLTFVGKTGTTTQIPSVSGTTAAVAHSFNPASYGEGEYTVTLTVNDKTPELPFIINMVLNRPTATIANLNKSADDAIPVVREGLFNLIGTADDVDVADTVSYKVEVYNHEGELISDVTPKPVNDKGYHVGRINNASLGELDFTMLRNNAYTLQLTVTDGQFTSTAEAEFALNSELKIGQFSFSNLDLLIPVGGMPISVIRTYNSLNSNKKGEFGYGWIYSIKDIEVDFNEERTMISDFDGETFSLRTGGGRDVTVTLPDGQRITFTFSLRHSGRATDLYYLAEWNPPAGINAKLEPTCSNKYVSLFGGMQFWEAGMYGTPMEYFDFPGFILTLSDGTKYEIVRESLGYHMLEEYVSNPPQVNAYGGAKLQQITDPKGNRTVFSDNEIISYNFHNERTNSIYFNKNDDDLITQIYAAESLNDDGSIKDNAYPNFKYEYDQKGNLIKAHRLSIINNNIPVYSTLTYNYDNNDRPHYVTGIIDPMGTSPMKCLYDDTGRLIGTEDSEGRIIQLQHDLSDKRETKYDRYGNPTIYCYDARGNIISTINAIGNFTKTTFDNNNNILSETDELGNTIQFTYNSAGKCTEVIYPDGSTTRYEYDVFGNITKEIDALGNSRTYLFNSEGKITKAISPLGLEYTHVYDSHGNIIQTIDSKNNSNGVYEYSSKSQYPIKFTNKKGVTYNMQYSAEGKIKSTSYIYDSENQNIKVTKSKEYDSAGNITKEINSDGNYMLYEYNLNEKISKISNNLGHTVDFKYDKRGNIIEKRYSNGTLARRIFDYENRLLFEQQNHIEGEKAIGKRYIYNSIGQIIRIEVLDNLRINIDSGSSNLSGYDSVIYSTSSTYDACGNIIEETDINGNIHKYEYNNMGRPIAHIDPLGNRFEYHYDSNGQLISIKDAENHQYYLKYNAVGNIVQIIYPDGSYIQNFYNESGKLVESIDNDGISKKYEYDDSDQLISVTKLSVSDSNGNETGIPKWKYKYDNYSNLIQIIDPKDKITKYDYDYCGRIVKRELPMGQFETYEYNSIGQLIKKVDFKGNIEQNIYNPEGYIQKKQFYSYNSASPDEEFEFEYDAFGRLITRSSINGQTKYEYDRLGNIIMIEKPEGTIKYSYNLANNSVKTITSSNTEINYDFDKLGRPNKILLTKRNGEFLSNPEITQYEYNKNGNKSKIILPNGIVSNFIYNSNNDLVELNHKKDGNLLASYEYALSSSGQRLSVNEKLRSGDIFINSNIIYKYDTQNRIIEEKRTGSNEFLTLYSYDLCGNRTKKVSNHSNETEYISYTYNPNDQLIAETSSLNGIINYNYDNNGSLTDMNKSEVFTCNYKYNSRNLLVNTNIQRKDNGKNINFQGEYIYDYYGNRVMTKENLNETNFEKIFLYENGLTKYPFIFEEKNPRQETLLNTFVIGDDIISQSPNGQSQYLLRDGHTNTRLIVNNIGNNLQNYDYDSYGNMLSGNPNFSTNYIANHLFAGEYFDKGLQMQYLRTRYYNPASGIFSQLDTYEGDVKRPESLHKYMYCHADPINNVDPSGMNAEGDTMPYTSGNGMIAHMLFTAYCAIVKKIPDGGRELGTLFPDKKDRVGWQAAELALKPDCVDKVRKRYNELKPITHLDKKERQVEDSERMITYDLALMPKGYSRGNSRLFIEEDFGIVPQYIGMIKGENGLVYQVLMYPPKEDTNPLINLEGLLYYSLTYIPNPPPFKVKVKVKEPSYRDSRIELPDYAPAAVVACGGLLLFGTAAIGLYYSWGNAYLISRASTPLPLSFAM